ncbi:hypothetical protein [Actinomadura sp. NEAU-AAG7]|uniref:TY-Chap domain-containing protein n=1 Tax=Actinomadura sp. NEAU-AAG7 TaxID=2839640 RepID=UPI001BE429F8|nr:hypothetical protein [Actinomadura sp. NEAU-AAG7]MBT2210797.1 hypothetical protein [Actinomadura sp. NEAU-AAG7]
MLSGTRSSRSGGRMGWDEFAEALAEELAVFPAGALVVIKEAAEPRFARYVQFAQRDAELDAGVVANSFLEEAAQCSPEGERVIAEAGWRTRQPTVGHQEWWYALPWPASSGEYRRLTGMIVTAFREGYGIADPGSWRYRAWNEREWNQAISLSRLGLERYE